MHRCKNYKLTVSANGVLCNSCMKIIPQHLNTRMLLLTVLGEPESKTTNYMKIDNDIKEKGFFQENKFAN